MPDASAAYASALLNLRHGAIELAGNDLARAAKLDPTMAAAQLRLALYTFDLTPTQAREALAAATRFRSGLDMRDLALLAIADASGADPPRSSDAADRARAAVEQFPDDAEVAYVLGSVLPAVDRLPEALAAFQHALELDSEYASTLAMLSLWDEQMQTFDEAMADADRCLARFSNASSCLLRRAELHEARGNCAALEADARGLTQMEPTLPRAHEYLGRALAAGGAPIESVRAALDRMVDLGEKVSPNYSRSAERYWLASLVGDFPEASLALRDADRELATQTDESVHGWIARTLVQIAEEIGDEPGARRISEEFRRRSAAWTQDSPMDFRKDHLLDLHRGGRISDAEFFQQRDALYREQCVRQPRPRGSIDADAIWLTYYALSNTPSETADSIARIRARGSVYDVWGDLGDVYLSAKDFDRAIVSLRRATIRCTVIPESIWPFAPTTLWWLYEQRILGEALEAKGARAGACAAYSVVMERWKNAKPRSITLEKARVRSRALGCDK